MLFPVSSNGENKALFGMSQIPEEEQCLFRLKKKKKDKRGSALGCFSIVLIIVSICNQDFGLPRRLDYDIHNSLAVSLLPIQ